jgi:hypothetical protein
MVQFAGRDLHTDGVGDLLDDRADIACGDLNQ